VQRYLFLFHSFGRLLLVLALEQLFPVRRKTPVLNKGWISDLVHNHDYLRSMAVGGISSAWMVHIVGSNPQGPFAEQSVALNFLMLVVVNEVTFYFIHRFCHANPFLWQFHRVHHSAVTYYSLIASRMHLVDALLTQVPPLIIALSLGARMEALIYYGLFRAFMDRYGHSNVNGPRRMLFLLSTPHYHAWHHATDPAAWNKNFSRYLSYSTT